MVHVFRFAVPGAPFRSGLRAAAVALLTIGVMACQQSTSPGAPPSTVAAPRGETATPSAAVRRVGLLVPLTGDIAAVGQDLARAAEMAVLERGGARLELLTRDTASTPQGAVLAARELLDTGDADVLLGPLVGSHAERVAAIARERGVLTLSFSSQQDIAGNGLFVLGYRPAQQVERVVGYAAGRGLSRVGALAPNDAYGRQAVDGLRAAIGRIPGGELVGVEFYSGDGTTAAGPIQALRGTTTDVAPFDALLIADGGGRLRTIARLLTENGLDPVDVRMLGTMLWQDDRAVLQEPSLRGGWYAGVPDAVLRDFRDRFRRAFGRDPHPLAVLGYDGLLIAADAADDRATALARITEPRGYQGEAGIIRLLPTGVAEHGLAIMELTSGGPVVVEPAPLRFDDGTS